MNAVLHWGAAAWRGTLQRPAILISLAALLAAALFGMALVIAIGVSVPQALAAFADGAWGSPYAVAASINRALALGLVGIGFVIAQRANLTNVGGEGQIAVGGIAATAVAKAGDWIGADDMIEIGRNRGRARPVGAAKPDA